MSLFAAVIFLLVNFSTPKEYCLKPDSDSRNYSEKSTANSSCDYEMSLNNISRMNSINDSNIKFCQGIYYLLSIWYIGESSNLTLYGMSGKTVVICKASESGIFFNNVSNVTLNNLEFQHCGITSSSKYAKRAALVFHRARSLKLAGIVVQEPSDAGGFVLDHLRGKVLIRDSMFKNSRLSKFNVTSGNFIGHQDKEYFSEVVIFNSSFENNSYDISKHRCSNRDSRLSAGLAIVLRLGNITVDLNNVTLRSNSGCAGGNLAVFLYQNLTSTCSSVNVTISNSIIENGFANIGGGVLFLLNRQEFFNKFIISDTTITNNRALFNGGGMFIKINQIKKLHKLSIIILLRCHFENNKLNQTKANGGNALQVTTFFLKGFQIHRTPQVNVTILSTKFINHRNDPQTSLLPSGNAVLYLKNSPLINVRDIIIANNTYSGITAVASNVILAGYVIITRNKAYSGGGIHLSSDALLYFSRHTFLEVTNNSAYYTGGGINVESGCTLNDPACFYQFYGYTFDNTSKAIVEGNTAKHAGDNIYGGAIRTCYFIQNFRYLRHKLQPKHQFNELFQVPNNSASEYSSISSTPLSLYLYGVTDKNIYPGQTVAFNATIYGQLRGITPGTVYGSLNDSRVFFRRGDSIQTLRYKKPYSFGNINYRFYSTEEGTSFSLNLKVSEGIANPHSRVTVVNFRLLHCPFGLELTKSRGSQSACSCIYLKNINHHTKNVKCFITKKVITYYPELWIGSIHGANRNKSKVIAVAIVCPQNYCLKEKVYLYLTDNPFDNNTQQCRYNRSGILCGECTNGKSVILGSSECRICSNGYLFLLLLFALAGPALVFVISFLNLTVSSATTNGIIFYANIVQVYGYSLFSKQPKFFKIFISWLNLDFGISTCLYDGMDGFSKAMMQFIFPVYLWIIAGILILLSKKYRVVVKLFGTNLVQVLATLFLLSYTKLIRAAMDAIMFTKLITPKVPYSPSHLRWSIDGNLQFFKGKHVIIFTVGTIFGILSLPYLLILIFIGQLPRISHWPLFSWINKWKPFFDCYTGPLSSKGRFWVGLLLAARVFLLVVYSINIASDKVSKMTTTIVVIMVLLFFSLTAPQGIYIKHYLNVLEILSIVNLGILFSGLLCSYHYDMKLMKEVVVMMSLGVCFLLFLMIIGKHINQRFGCIRAFKCIRSWRQSNNNHNFDSTDRIPTHCSLRIPPYKLPSDTDRLLPSRDESNALACDHY